MKPIQSIYTQINLRTAIKSPLFWLFVCGGLLRVYYCFQLPVYTTDLLRNLGYGKAFYTWGYRIYDLVPFDFSPAPSQFLWPNRKYPYPAVTILFYAAVAGVWSSVFFGKLALTLIDTVSARYIYKLTNSRLISLLYWINPMSLWYSSREGQFEGLIVLWIVLAMWALRNKKAYAYALLGLAIQTKLFPVFLGPYFLSKMSWRNPKKLAWEWGFGIISFTPSLIAVVTSGYLTQFIGTGYLPNYNPLSWNLGDPSLYQSYPFWLILAHWIAGFVFVLGCAYGAIRTKEYLGFFAPFVFVWFVKMNIIGQFWYLMQTPAYCLTVSNNRYRILLFCLSFLLGIRSLWSIFIGPVGYQNPEDAMYLVKTAFWGF